MKFLKATICFITVLVSINLYSQKLESIDSLYLSTVEEFYQNAEKSKQSIWEGMTLSPICLFRINGPAILYNHPNPPQSFKRHSDRLYIGTQNELQIFGATTAKINGVLTAIVDYERIYDSSIEVYSELFHELHHAYQMQNISNIEFDNPVTLLRYPENYDNDAIKLFEQETLYRLYKTENQKTFNKLLNQFYSSRLKREKIIGKTFSEYEQHVENMEGPARYCQYRYYYTFSEKESILKDNYIEKEFLGVLTTPYFGRSNLRFRHLASGMTMCLILDKYHKDWKTEYYSQKENLYNFFLSKFNPKQIPINLNQEIIEICKYQTGKEIAKHQENIKEFNASFGTKVILEFKKTPMFKGFDPMNAESINDSTILHKTLLRLGNSNNDELFITNGNSLTTIKKQIWFVDKVILYVSDKDIDLTDNMITIKNENIQVSWKGKLKNENDDEIEFICE